MCFGLVTCRICAGSINLQCSQEQGFKAFFKGDKVTEDNEMFCDSCSKKREAEIVSHQAEASPLIDCVHFSVTHGVVFTSWSRTVR